MSYYGYGQPQQPSYGGYSSSQPTYGNYSGTQPTYGNYGTSPPAYGTYGQQPYSPPPPAPFTSPWQPPAPPPPPKDEKKSSGDPIWPGVLAVTMSLAMALGVAYVGITSADSSGGVAKGNGQVSVGKNGRPGKPGGTGARSTDIARTLPATSGEGAFAGVTVPPTNHPYSGAYVQPPVSGGLQMPEDPAPPSVPDRAAAPEADPAVIEPAPMPAPPVNSTGNEDATPKPPVVAATNVKPETSPKPEAAKPEPTKPASEPTVTVAPVGPVEAAPTPRPMPTPAVSPALNPAPAATVAMIPPANPQNGMLLGDFDMAFPGADGRSQVHVRFRAHLRPGAPVMHQGILKLAIMDSVTHGLSTSGKAPRSPADLEALPFGQTQGLGATYHVDPLLAQGKMLRLGDVIAIDQLRVEASSNLAGRTN